MSRDSQPSHFISHLGAPPLAPSGAFWRQAGRQGREIRQVAAHFGPLGSSSSQHRRTPEIVL